MTKDEAWEKLCELNDEYNRKYDEITDKLKKEGRKIYGLDGGNPETDKLNKELKLESIKIIKKIDTSEYSDEEKINLQRLIDFLQRIADKY